MGVGGGRDLGLGERWFFLVLQEYLQLNSQRRWSDKPQQLCGWPMEVSLIRAALEHLVDCSSLDTSLFEVANPDSAFPGASWLRDLRNLRRTEYADLGNVLTESERLDAWQDPDGREQQQIGHLFFIITRSSCCAGTSNSRITVSTASCKKSCQLFISCRCCSIS